jgi:hypothetical protein
MCYISMVIQAARDIRKPTKRLSVITRSRVWERGVGAHFNTVQIKATIPKAAEVGTVFIASAVEVQSRWSSIPLVDEVASVLLLHGGRDEYGPYLGSPYLNGIGAHFIAPANGLSPRGRNEVRPYVRKRKYEACYSHNSTRSAT